MTTRSSYFSVQSRDELNTFRKKVRKILKRGHFDVFTSSRVGASPCPDVPRMRDDEATGLRPSARTVAGGAGGRPAVAAFSGVVFRDIS